MSTSAYSQRISYRVAAEGLLISEEKWILEALKKIKTQRNCLQIERLQLESMKAKLKATDKDSCEGESNLPTQLTDSAPSGSGMEPMATSSTANLMQVQGKITSSQIIEFEPNLLDVEAFCNDQTLNLSVTNPIFSNPSSSFNMEEHEEEEEFEEFDDDMPIDMDMLMSGANMDD